MEMITEEAGWQELSCLRGRIRIVLPQGWERPADEILKKKFPYNTTPQEVFADAQADRIITLNILDKQLQDKQVYPAIREMQRVIGRVYPESIKEQARSLKTEAGTVGYFSFITGGVKVDAYHNMFILPVDEKMLLGSFHLPTGQMHEGKKLLLKMINSIQIRREGKTNERISD